MQALANGENLASGYSNFPGLDALEVKTEECQLSFKSTYNQHPFMPHSYSSVENAAKMMQRSYSSNSFEGKPGFLFQPRFDTLLESPNYQSQALSSPENNFLAGQLRRVYSTGDLQVKPLTNPFQSPVFALFCPVSLSSIANGILFCLSFRILIEQRMQQRGPFQVL